MTDPPPYPQSERAAVREDDVEFVAALCADLSAHARHLAAVTPVGVALASITGIADNEPR
ncbi:MAG: hypothetical protein JWP19_1209 [Rhodoglobus sp.]|jgi:hypothetical protein|nr:hypothetical protein [Rhodoglobus sp.]